MNQPMPNPNAEPSPVPEAAAASSGSISVGLGRTQYDSGGITPHSTGAATPLKLGRLGKYRIQKELGRGGMGAVYLAFDERLQRKVALKVMLPNAAADRGAKERFLREARAAAQISSDHVVNIYEADEIDGTPYIALQFLQGYPLDEYLNKQGNPSIPQIIRIGQETALGLEAAHQLGLVHRDIKPANLWLESPNGRVKILDFGLARQQQADNVNLTRKGTVVGTPAYMSPEQARGLALDHRSDLFSLGGVLYRLCTGRLPFSGDTTIALLTALAVDEPTPVRQLNPSVPEPLASLVHRLLAKDPTQRPPTAKAVADELNAIFNWSQTQQQVNQLPVVYVPMAITPHQEANPFEGITEVGSVATSSVTQVDGEDEPPSTAKPFPRMLVASLLFALLVVVGAVLLLTHKPNTEMAKRDSEPPPLPQKGTSSNPPSKNTDQPIVMDADRIATQWVLDIGGTVKISGVVPAIKGSEKLPREPFHLLEVYLSDNKQLNDDTMAKFKDCQHLKTLNIHGTNVGDSGVLHLIECKALTNLTLLNTRVTDLTLKQLQAYPRFLYLDVRASGVSEQAVKALAAALPLCKVIWNGGIIEPKKSPDRLAAEYVISLGASAILEGNRQVTKLEDLPNGDWQLVEVFAGNKPTLTDAGLENFKGCQSIRKLTLNGSGVTGTGLVHLKGNTQLNQLWFTTAPVTDEGLVHLKEFPNLAFLNLAGTKVTDEGLVHLKDCKKLTTLSIGHTKLTGAGLAHLKDCKAITDVWVDHSLLSDAALQNLKGFENLTKLMVDTTPLSDAGLEHLKVLKKLSYLDVRKTKVTAAGVAALQKALPLCEINWDGSQPKK